MLSFTLLLLSFFVLNNCIKSQPEVKKTLGLLLLTVKLSVLYVKQVLLTFFPKRRSIVSLDAT